MAVTKKSLINATSKKTTTKMSGPKPAKPTSAEKLATAVKVF